MPLIGRLIIQTLMKGGVYALLASGFSLIFGMAHIINLAHTAFFMLAAYGMFYFMHDLGWGTAPSIALTLVGVTLLGVLAYRFILNRIREHIVAVLLITIALGLVIQEVMVLAFGNHYLVAPPIVAGYTKIAGVSVANQQILSLGIMAVVIVFLWLALTKTKLGVSIRATAQDAEIASLMGISVPRTLTITMGIATALAAVGGISVAPLWTIYPQMWSPLLVMVMVIVVLGGLGSIKGSFIGAFIIALVENLIIFFMPSGSYLTTVFALLFMVIVLVVRPAGLFGTIFEEEKL